MEENNQPLISSGEDQKNFLRRSNHSFILAPDDIRPINGVGDFLKEFSAEFNRLWYLAAPAIFTTICQFSLGAITQVFAGHVSTLALAAVSIENSVIAGFSFGIMRERLKRVVTNRNQTKSAV
ncbi:Multi antimicrobial extrusion protein [Parasponia andersonii]|uniref:Multi antimicrobial extrusion protein n=1 Tax=Parasponia andersonii TaxID=3476 RepID=A0A2P5CT49_PARAD|nr:Multi antimicrobial extrusion protein [Parasponia andersonii]